MSVTKDGNTGRWMSQIRVKDWTGKTVHKKKRGFKTKREALQWEQDEALQWEQEFVSQTTSSLGMTFQTFIELYFNDMEKRLKPTTLANKRWIVDLKVTPFFGKMPLNDIKPTDIRRWQNALTSYRNETGEPYSATYLKTINNQITAIFNYAVKYYGLKENPCHKAGGMEFLKFIEAMKDHPAGYAAFMTMYYTGVREGELLALTLSDIDFENGTIRINKSYQRLNGEDLITTPKTPKSKRVITIPESLKTCLKEYTSKLYLIQTTDRIFPYTKSFLSHEMDYGCKESGVKRIRIHDLRHSHAAALIEMNVAPKLLQERLGHERIQTTLDTYGHLYPNKQAEVAKQLDEFMSG